MLAASTAFSLHRVYRKKKEKREDRTATEPACWWERKLVQPPWKAVWRFLENTKMRVTIRSSNPTPWAYTQRKTRSERYLDPSVHCSAIYNSQVTKATQRPSAEQWMWKLWCTCARECHSEQKNPICRKVDGLVRIILKTNR